MRLFFADCGMRERSKTTRAAAGAPRPQGAAAGIRNPPRAGHSRTHKNALEHYQTKSTLLNTYILIYEQAGRSAAAHSEVRTAHTIAHAGCPGCGPMHIRLLFRRNFETGDVISLS